ncbi:MFS transporter [Micromonospora sp. NPDC050980]|uniref:MFS transporter n=1 Tax=Micromonospora sp. NPDC050980 TaxID=3155161 RepID=UPI0033C97433
MGRIRQYLREYVPSSRAGRTLAAVAVVDSVGTGLYLAGSMLYFVRGIGLSATGVGQGLALAGVVGLATTVPLGLIGDRIGVKRMLMLLQTWRALMLVALAFATDLTGFVVAAVGLTIAVRSATPASQAVVAAVMTGPDRVTTMALMRSIRNVGYSLGALLTVPIFAADTLWAYRSILLTNAATFLGAVVLLATLRVAPGTVVPVSARKQYPTGLWDWRLLLVALLNGVFSLHTVILAVGVPLWALAVDAPLWLVSVLFVLNTVLAVLLQVATARGSDQPGFGERALIRSAYALILCCVLFAAAPLGGGYVVVVALIAGMVALTGGELWHSAGSWELAFRLAPPAQRAEYLAVFNLGPAVTDIAGPLLLTAVVAYRSPGWLALAVLLAGMGLTIRVIVRTAERQAAARDETPSPDGDARAYAEPAGQAGQPVGGRPADPAEPAVSGPVDHGPSLSR